MDTSRVCAFVVLCQAKCCLFIESSSNKVRPCGLFGIRRRCVVVLGSRFTQYNIREWGQAVAKRGSEFGVNL